MKTTKAEKLDAWAKAFGYPCRIQSKVILVTEDADGLRGAWTSFAPIELKERKVLGILDESFIFHKAPEFEDDKPEETDAPIQEYLKSYGPDDVISNFNDRLKALEAKIK